MIEGTWKMQKYRPQMFTIRPAIDASVRYCTYPLTRRTQYYTRTQPLHTLISGRRWILQCGQMTFDIVRSALEHLFGNTSREPISLSTGSVTFRYSTSAGGVEGWLIREDSVSGTLDFAMASAKQTILDFREFIVARKQSRKSRVSRQYSWFVVVDTFTVFIVLILTLWGHLSAAFRKRTTNFHLSNTAMLLLS